MAESPQPDPVTESTRGAGPQSADFRDRPGEGVGDAREFGPYDITDAPEAERIDLGSLKIPTVPGVELRVQANGEGVVQQVVLGTEESVLQLAAFAAPRSEGIWDEVRARIRRSLIDEGVTVEEVPGDYGRELRAAVRSEQGKTDLRFVGVDGPRWMVRAVYQGQAALDPAAAGPLAACLQGLVVDRGKEAMPAEDALPLRLPREFAEAAAQAQADASAAGHEHADPHGGATVNGAVVNGAPAPNGMSNPSAEPHRPPSPRPRRPE